MRRGIEIWKRGQEKALAAVEANRNIRQIKN